LAASVLSYDSEACTVSKEDGRASHISSNEILETAGCNLLDHERSELITEELKITPSHNACSSEEEIGCNV
jgi:hypothetical protein